MKRAEARAEAMRLERQIEGIRRRLRAPLEVEIGKGGLTAPQRLVMQELVRSKESSLKELSVSVGLAHSTVSGIVDRLQSQGLIERRVSENDRRVTFIRPSALVESFLRKEMPKLVTTPLVRALNGASTEERGKLREGLDTLERLLERTAPSGGTS